MKTKKLSIKLIFTFLIISTAFYNKNISAESIESNSVKVPNVFIITLFGVRGSDSIEDVTHQYIPNLWNNMLGNGTLYTNLYSMDFQFHMSSMDAINYGVSSPIWSRINVPSIFQYIRKKFDLPAYKLWSIKHFLEQGCFYNTDNYAEDTNPCYITWNMDVSSELKKILPKEQLSFIENCRVLKNNFSGFGFGQWDSYQEIDYLFFKKILQEFKPKFVHYGLLGTETGHYDMFSRYVFSLKRSDEIIFEIWQMIDQDPFYKGNTYLIVCPDHGRNAYYMQHDEGAYDKPTPVWLYIYGPNIKKGKTINRPIRHIDIFATVANIMDVETHPTEGEVLQDCFLLRQE